MGLRSKLKNKLKGVMENFSGEYSSAAPDEVKPYDRPGTPADPSSIPRARLNRPKKSKTDSDEAAD